jgi:PAS domain S-box-containing protein
MQPEDDRDDRDERIEELRRERDLLKALIDSTPHFFVAIDAEGKTRLMNPAMLEALGYEEDEVIGTDYLETFVLYEDRPALQEVFERIVKGRQRTLNENHVLTKEGQAILVQWHGTPMYDSMGEITYFFGVGTDITERRHLDRLVAEREARYREVFARCRDPMIFADGAGRVLDANAAAEACFGLRLWELRRKWAAELGLPAPDPGTTTGTVHHRNGLAIPCEIRISTFVTNDRTQVLYLLVPDGALPPPSPEEE